IQSLTQATKRAQPTRLGVAGALCALGNGSSLDIGCLWLRLRKGSGSDLLRFGIMPMAVDHPRRCRSTDKDAFRRRNAFVDWRRRRWRLAARSGTFKSITLRQRIM